MYSIDNIRFILNLFEKYDFSNVISYKVIRKNRSTTKIKLINTNNFIIINVTSSNIIITYNCGESCVDEIILDKFEYIYPFVLIFLYRHNNPDTNVKDTITLVNNILYGK